MNTLNFIIRNNHDEDGITEALIGEIKSSYSIGKGIVYDAALNMRKQAVGIEYKSTAPIGQHDCLEIRNQNRIVLDGAILDAMLPYKSMAMHIMMRESQYDVYERAYLEKVYYRHLKYWYTELIENQINAVFFLIAPHHCGEYILYSLAQILKIPTVILYPQIDHNGMFFFMGHSLDSIGNNIEQKYNTLSNSEIILDKYMQSVIARIENKTVMGASNRAYWVKNAYEMMHKYVSRIGIWKDVKRLWLIRLNIEKRRYKKESIQTYKRRIVLKKNIKKHIKEMDTIELYQKIARQPNWEERYIFFPLQETPECSTMPLAGEFKNQVLSIELLASVAQEYGIKIYVKEHWIQIYREPGVYKELKSIEGVTLIDSEINSIELIEHSLAVASQTGNCLFEAMIKKKPAIAVGKGCTYKGAPNIFRVNTRKEVEEAIKKIIKGVKISDVEVKKYCYAISESGVFLYGDSLQEAAPFYDKYLTAKKVMNYFLENN